MNYPVDFKGHDFQFIPFGAGRRIAFAMVTNEFVIGSCPMEEMLDTAELPGVTIHRKVPLLAVATSVVG